MNYLISLLVGFVFGVGHALLGVKSPAPPIVALFGLLGMVIGEQGVPWVKQHYQRPAITESRASPSNDAESVRR